MKHHPRIWERPMLLLLFLFGLGAWNRAWVFFLLLAALSLALWGLRTDFSRSEVLLLFFSLFYALADTYHGGLSLRVCALYLLGPWVFYRLGKAYALHTGSCSGFCQLLAAPSLGMWLHGLLNWLARLRWQGEALPARTAVDFWRGEPVSVTCTGMLLTAAAALALGRLCSPGKAAGKWAAFLCLGSCLAESAYFANRTLPLLCALLLAAQAWKWLLRPTGEPKLRRCAGILFALLFLALALRGNLWGLRSWLLSLPLTRRLLNPGEGLSRLEIWSAFFRGGRWLRFPLGGNRLTQGLPFTWFHNLWLDLYCHGGALPFLLFSAFTLLELRHSLAFFRTMKAVRWERSRNAAANLLPALLLNAMVEPVMEANVYVFLTALLFLGAVRGQRLRALKEAEAFQPSTPATPSREEVLRL